MDARAEEPAVRPQAGRRLPATVIATGWASFFNDVSGEMISPLLPIFLTSTLGVGMGFIGLIEGIAESAASLVKLFSGWLSDRLGRRKMLVVVGYGLASVARPLLAVAMTGWQVLGLRLADRVGKGIRGAPRDALLADFTEHSTRGLAYGYQRAMDHAGAVVGPLLATGLLAALALEYRQLFALAAIPAALCLAIVWKFVSEPPCKPPVGTQPHPLSGLLSALRGMDRRLTGLLLAVGLFALGNSSDAFLILRARDLDVSVEWIPMIWVTLHVSKSLLSIPAGLLSDRIGRRPTILAGWITYGLVYIGFAFCGNQGQVWFLFAAYGLYFALTEGVERAFIADVVKPEQRGLAFGLYNFVLGLAALPASLIFGGVGEWISFRAAFLLGAALALAASALLLMLTRPVEYHEHTP